MSAARQMTGYVCLAAGLWLAGPDTPARADSLPLSLAEAACAAFTGKPECDTVSIDDPVNCVLKVLAGPAPPVEPENAACLFDEVGTAKVHLRRIGTSLPKVSGLGIRIGGGAVELVTKYGAHGAPVWELREGHTFALKGPVKTTRRALRTLRQLTVEHCAGPAQTSVAASVAAPAGPKITAKAAFAAAAGGALTLVDIRHEAEWRATGVGLHAAPITMHQNIRDFVGQLTAALAGDKNRPVALICAEGVRSAHMQRALKLYGFSDVRNVAEGMAGSAAGPGWLKAGLPVRPHPPEQAAR